MKKALLLSLGVAVAAVGFAFPLKKSAKTVTATKLANHTASSLPSFAKSNKAAKTTGVTYDTTVIGNDLDILSGDANLFAADQAGDIDSGFLFGPNLSGFTGFAERYDVFPNTGYNISILGIGSLWGGTINANSTNSVALNIWNVDSSSALDPNFPNDPYYMSALPGTIQSTVNVPLTDLIAGLNLAGLTQTALTNPMTNYAGSFYAGFIPNFTYAAGATTGDTISLFSSSPDSGANTFEAGIVNGDTTLYARTVSQINGTWQDNAFDLGFNNNYAIFPIVAIIDSNGTTDTGSTGIAHVTANNLTIFANYPNPAISSTNLMFSLSQNANVTIQIYDAAGRLVNTINQANQSVGKHTVNISTASMPAGNYVCVFRTNLGDAIGSQLTVIK